MALSTAGPWGRGGRESVEQEIMEVCAPRVLVTQQRLVNAVAFFIKNGMLQGKMDEGHIVQTYS